MQRFLIPFSGSLLRTAEHAMFCYANRRTDNQAKAKILRQFMIFVWSRAHLRPVLQT